MSEKYTFECHKLIDSTNDRAKLLAREGAVAGTVVIAEGQSAGRGRLGRTFASQSGAGIYMSVIFRTGLPATEATKITAFTAVCVAEAIDSLFGTKCEIKWVNDIIIDNKKVCGILTESGFSSCDSPDFTVVGIGINVKHTDFTGELAGIAGSVEDFSTKSAGQEELVSLILEKLSPLLSGVIPSDAMERYRARSYTLFKEVYSPSNPEICGKAAEISDDGSLIIEKNGKKIAVSAGEISIRLI